MAKITTLGLIGVPSTAQTFEDKTPAGYPAQGLLVEEFDIWQEDYDGAQVSVFYAGTTTLMPLFSDPELTQAIDNPQVLVTKTDQAGRRYGKFSTSVYVPFSYYLDIDSAQQTGVRQVPIYTLDGEDASSAEAATQGSTLRRSLSSRFADVINLADYGQITTSATTNTTTLNSAIGAASNKGGGVVVLPAGSILIRSITLPSNVILRGQGKGVTTLQSTLGGNVITASSDSGLVDLTLDGLVLTPGSVGIYGKNVDNFRIEDVEVKRFDVCVFWQGGQDHRYKNFDVSDARICYRARGDSNTSGGGGGDKFNGMSWDGGSVSLSTGTGLELYVADRVVSNNIIRNVRFSDTTGLDGALFVYGAQRTVLEGCEWQDNIVNLVVKDNPDTSLAEDDRRVSGLHFYGGIFTEGTNKFDGYCDDVELNNMLCVDVEFSLLTPTNSILLRDSRESGVTVTSEASKFLRLEGKTFGSARVNTTVDGDTTIFRQRLAPNRIALITASIIAEQVNGTGNASWIIAQAARGALATLAYDNQTANFTVGNNIVGATSGATATIAADSDSGTTGTLSLANVVGTFSDNEVISESDGSGSAQVNGALTEGSAALIGTIGSVYSSGSNAGSPPAAWSAVFAVTGQEVLLVVNGAASTKIQWDAKVDIVYRDRG